MDNLPEGLVSALRTSRHLVVLSGAGLSAESGIPTFRQAQTGLWAQYRAEELATPQAFRRNPRLVWEWYTWRRELVAKAQPNPGHLALVQLEAHFQRSSKHFCHVTQNVDGLNQRAGGKTVIELHGSLQRSRCFDENLLVEPSPEDSSIPPCCPRCGGFLRPDVVWFGENLPPQALDTAFQQASTCDLFIAVGTSLLVQPAASLPYIARDHGAILVDINPTPTPLSETADHVLLQPAGVALPALVAAIRE